MGELPKLFGKAFAVGFLLPAAAFALGLAALLTRFGLLKDPVGRIFDAKVADVAVSVVLLWLGAVCLMALNRPILRLVEGYGALNPARLLQTIAVRRFERLSDEANWLQCKLDEAVNAGTALPQADRARRTVLLRALANDYPDQSAHVLPTRFGNIMRAYEVYPRVVYGIEGIQGWNRLVSVLPDGFRTQIEDAKSQTDFWINIWVVSMLLLICYVSLVWPLPHVKHLWMAETFLAVALVSIPSATAMAREWGALVMSAFDLYRGDLAKKLGLDLPRSIVHEREMWTAFSQMTVYRSPKAAHRLGPYRTRSGSGVET